jgi:hypothetical protein
MIESRIRSASQVEGGESGATACSLTVSLSRRQSGERESVKKREYPVISLRIVETSLLAACGAGGAAEEPVSELVGTSEQAAAEPDEDGG